MATRTQVVRISDLSGEDLGEGGVSVNFSVGSDNYMIDLSDKEAEKFFDALKKYTDVATKTAGRGVRKSGGASSTRGNPQTKAIKEWALANGIDVPQRGRIPRSIIEQYETAR